MYCIGVLVLALLSLGEGFNTGIYSSDCCQGSPCLGGSWSQSCGPSPCGPGPCGSCSDNIVFPKFGCNSCCQSSLPVITKTLTPFQTTCRRHIPIASCRPRNVLDWSIEHVPQTKSLVLPRLECYSEHVPFTCRFPRPVINKCTCNPCLDKLACLREKIAKKLAKLGLGCNPCQSSCNCGGGCNCPSPCACKSYSCQPFGSSFPCSQPSFFPGSLPSPYC